MATIPISQAKGIFTQKLIATYKEQNTPTSFLRSFFTVKESDTLYISIEVQRGTEKIAADVMRGTEGNRNTFSKSSEKIIQPPYYREYFDATELDFYDTLFGEGQGVVSAVKFKSWMDKIIEKILMLQFKIERRYELQAAQVMEDGIVTLTNGDNIDFKRKALSKVTVSTKWDSGASVPLTDIATGLKFLRTVGKAGGGTFNMICGENAIAELLSHADIKENANLRNYDLAFIREPQRNAVGGTLHGQISVGAYKVNLWSYPEFYDNASGVSTSYLDTKKVTLLPLAPKFVMSYAGVPRLVDTPKSTGLSKAIAPTKGAFVVGRYIDERNTTDVFDIKSAGVAIPLAVDQIYTMQVLA